MSFTVHISKNPQPELNVMGQRKGTALPEGSFLLCFSDLLQTAEASELPKNEEDLSEFRFPKIKVLLPVPVSPTGIW